MEPVRRKSQLDEARFPRLAAYVRALPNGLASHPEAEMKASLYRSALEDRPVDSVADRLPPEVADLVLRPKLVSTWVRTAHAQALYLAIADHHRMSSEAFHDWAYGQHKKLFAGPLYRALVSFASPSMLLSGAALRWRAIHRGTQIEIESSSPDEATCTMVYPRGLYAPLNLIGFATGFRAIAEISNGRVVAYELAATTPTSASFSVKWR